MGKLPRPRIARNPQHIEYLERFGENVERLHTSGHATMECLMELCEMTSPRLAIIPIHSEQPAYYRAIVAHYANLEKIAQRPNFCPSILLSHIPQIQNINSYLPYIAIVRGKLNRYIDD